MKLWQVAPFFHSLLVRFVIWKEKRQSCLFSFQFTNLTKSEWKKRGNLSEFHSERNYYLQNWYFSQELFFGISYSKPALAKLHFPEFGFTIPRLWHSVCTWALIVLSKIRIWIWFHFRFRIRHQALLPVLRLRGGRYPNGIGPWGWQGKGFVGQFLSSQPFRYWKGDHQLLPADFFGSIRLISERIPHCDQPHHEILQPGI